MLDLADFSRNARPAGVRRFGACYVRYGKAMRGWPAAAAHRADRMAWAVEALAEYVEEIRPLLRRRRPAACGRPNAAAGSARDDIDDRFAAVPRRARTATGAAPALPAPLLRHAPDRGRLRPAVRAAARSATPGGQPTALYTGVGVRLHEQRPARRAGPPARRTRPPQATGANGAGLMAATDRLPLAPAHSSWPGRACSPPPTWRPHLAERGHHLSPPRSTGWSPDPGTAEPARPGRALRHPRLHPGDLVEPYVAAKHRPRPQDRGARPRRPNRRGPGLRPTRARIVDPDHQQ